MKTFNVTYPVALTVALLLCGNGQSQTVTREIQVENNDAEERLNTPANSGDTEAQGFVDLASTDLEIASEGDGGLDWQVIGLQYDTLGIPQGATITSASITFTVDNTGNAGDSNLTILAEAVDNSTVFAVAAFDITSRSRSTASVAWAPAANNTIGATVVTSDISAVIQEIVNRAGWSDNNLLTLMIYPDVYLALPDPTTGGTTVVQELELEAGPGADSATLTVDFTVPNLNLTVVGSTFAVAGGAIVLSASGDMLSPFQWTKNNVDIVGETGSSLTLDPTVVGDTGTYRLEAVDGASAPITSNAISITIVPAGTSLPATGVIGLLALAGGCALGGVRVIRRRK